MKEVNGGRGGTRTPDLLGVKRFQSVFFKRSFYPQPVDTQHSATDCNLQLVRLNSVRFARNRTVLSEPRLNFNCTMLRWSPVKHSSKNYLSEAPSTRREHWIL